MVYRYIMKAKKDQEEKKLMKKTTLQFDVEFHKRLRILAIEEGISMTGLVKKAVEEYLARKGKMGGK